MNIMSKSWLQASSFSTITPGFIVDVDISKIKQCKNIRHNICDTEELAKSIEQKGLLQPILVRTLDGSFEIVAGNRRYSACKALGWKKIACHIIELDDKQAFEVSLIENVQRKSLSALDEATAFKAYVSDFGWGGASDLGSRIGKSVSYITKRMKLLNLLSDVLESIMNRRLDPSLAEELLRCGGFLLVAVASSRILGEMSTRCISSLSSSYYCPPPYHSCPKMLMSAKYFSSLNLEIIPLLLLVHLDSTDSMKFKS
jgi:ParB/RepB/Spo0J family partition protein